MTMYFLPRCFLASTIVKTLRCSHFWWAVFHVGSLFCFPLAQAGAPSGILNGLEFEDLCDFKRRKHFVFWFHDVSFSLVVVVVVYVGVVVAFRLFLPLFVLKQFGNLGIERKFSTESILIHLELAVVPMRKVR